MQLALALLADAVAAAAEGQPEEAVNLTLLAEKALEGGEGAEVRDTRAAARLVRAGQLRVLGDVDAAAAAYRSVIEDFGGDAELELRYRVTAAYANAIQLRAGFGTVDEAAALAGELVALRGADPEAEIRALVAAEREGLLVRWLEAGRDEEAVEAAQALVAALGADPGERLRVARALLNQGLALRRLGREAEVLPAFQQLVARFDGEAAAGDPELAALVVRAIAECAQIAAARDPQGGLFIADSALAAYGAPEGGPAADEALADELLRLRTLRARFLGGLGRLDEARAAYDALAADCAAAPSGFARDLAALAGRDRAFFGI